MSKLKITIECTGDAITALSEARQLCIGGNYETLFVYFPDIDKHIAVHKDSNIVDLSEIYSLNHKLKSKQ